MMKHTQTFVGMTIFIFEDTLYLSREVANKVLLYCCVRGKWHSVCEDHFSNPNCNTFTTMIKFVPLEFLGVSQRIL